MSHEPVILATMSPFQIIAVLLAGIGAAASMYWCVKNSSKVRAILKTWYQSPLVWCLLFLLWVSLSLIWGGRAEQLYFIAIVWVGFFFAIGFYLCAVKSDLPYKKIVQLIVGAALAISLISAYQFIGDSVGLQRTYTQICTTCGSVGVGVARSSGFSAEPQYFSFLLLLPLVILLHSILWKKRLFRPAVEWLMLGVLLLPFLLGSSRGGFLALGLVLAAYAVLAVSKKQFASIMGVSFTVICSVVVTLLLVAWSGTVQDRVGADYTVERYVSHSTGGLIVLGEEEERLDQIEQKIEQRRNEKKNIEEEFNYVADAQDFGQTGAVIYSTQSRLETYKIAFNIWRQDIKTILIGVGWGNFGAVAATRSSVYTASNVVNNQPLQIVAELGLVGLVLFFLSLAAFVKFFAGALWQKRRDIVISSGILLSAYALQLLFFSALHLLQIWFTLSLMYVFVYLMDNRKLDPRAGRE